MKTDLSEVEKYTLEQAGMYHLLSVINGKSVEPNLRKLITLRKYYLAQKINPNVYLDTRGHIQYHKKKVGRNGLFKHRRRIQKRIPEVIDSGESKTY